jgi:hypothetical protein
MIEGRLLTDASPFFAGAATAWGPRWDRLHPRSTESCLLDSPASPLRGVVAGGCVQVLPLGVSGFSERPPEFNLMQIWDRQFGLRLTDPCATSLRMSCLRDEMSSKSTLAFVLDDLASWTGLSNDQLGLALGASRRSIYNWRQGAPVSADAQDRILRVHVRLQPMAARHAPAMLRAWLEAGAPSPLELLHEERWEEFDRLLAAATEPKPTRAVQPSGRQTDPEAYGAKTRQLMLEAFTAGVTLAARRPDWQARELTGLDEIEEDDT